MCLIISGKGKNIPFAILEDASAKNQDGWGLMYHNDGKIITIKSPKEDADAIYEITKKLDHDVIVHLRMTTHGGNTMENTHPFEVVKDRLYMMHNGIVSVPACPERKRSDTRIMVDEYLKPLITDPAGIDNKGIQNFIQSLIGTSSNRLVFLDDTGKTTYFNKNLGLEWKGLWCSNTYAWTLHTEGKSTGFGNYDRYWTGSSRATTSATKPIWQDHWGYLDDYDDKDAIKWESGNVQAEDDWWDEEVNTDLGYIIPRWVMYALDLKDDEIAGNEETVAEAMRYIKDNIIGTEEEA